METVPGNKVTLQHGFEQRPVGKKFVFNCLLTRRIFSSSVTCLGQLVLLARISRHIFVETELFET